MATPKLPGPDSPAIGEWAGGTGITVLANHLVSENVRDYIGTLTASVHNDIPAPTGYHYVYQLRKLSVAEVSSTGAPLSWTWILAPDSSTEPAGCGSTYAPAGWQISPSFDVETFSDDYIIYASLIKDYENKLFCVSAKSYKVHVVQSDLFGTLDVTGNGSQTSNATVDVYAHLFAQTSTGHTITSATIDWGDGSAPESVSIPSGLQAYDSETDNPGGSEAISHTYDVALGGNIFAPEVTYTDSEGNTLVVRDYYSVCRYDLVSDQSCADMWLDIQGHFNQLNPDPYIVIEEVSSSLEDGVYTRCYKLGVTPDLARHTRLMKYDDLASTYPLPLIILPDNVTITDGGGWKIGRGSYYYSVSGVVVHGNFELPDSLVPQLTNSGIVQFCITSYDDNDWGAYISSFALDCFGCDVGRNRLDINDTFGTLSDFVNDPVLTCPDGQHDDGTGTCIDDATSGDTNPCEDGFYWTGTFCRENDNTGSELCSPGFEYYDGACHPIHTTVTCPTGFHDDGTGTCIADATGGYPETCAAGYYHNGTACVRIPEPDACIKNIDVMANTATLLVQDYGSANLPTGATGVLLQQFNGTTWDTVKTILAADANAAFELNVTQIDYLRFLWEFTISTVTYTGNYADVTTSCCAGNVAIPPGAPAAPVPVKDCANEKITFPVTLAAGVDSVEVTRDDAPDTIIGTFTAPGTFVDLDVEWGTYKYRLRAKAGSLYSEYSAWSAAVDFTSATGVIALTEPANGSTKSHVQAIKFAATGVDKTTLAVTVNGQPVGQVIPWPDRVNQYYAWWDTRNSLNGTANIVVTGTGTDGCPARGTSTVTVNNTPANNVVYFDVGPTSILDTSWYRISSIVRLVTGALNPNVLRQWYVRVGLRTWKDAETDPVTAAAATPEEAEEQWLLHTPIVDFAKIGGCSAKNDRPELRNFFSTPSHPKAHHIVSRYRLDPLETVVGFDLSPSTSVVKMREIPSSGDTKGATMIFGAPGTIWEFANDAVTLVKDLDDYGAAAATDVAWIADKIYAIVGGELRAFDTTPSDINYTLNIRGADGTLEPRPPQFVERVGSDLLVVCVDEDLTPATKTYKVSGANISPLWDIAEAVTKVDIGGDTATKVLLACGAKYYSSENLATPTLKHTFSSSINAFATADDDVLAALANGEVWRGEDSWVKLSTLATAATGVSEWYGALGVDGGFRALATGESDLHLHEENANHTWSAGRVVAAPSASGKTVTSISAIRRVAWQETVTTTNLDGSTTDSTQTAERLLVGTGNDGVLLAYQVSTLATANYPVISNVYSARVFPLTGIKPPATV